MAGLKELTGDPIAALATPPGRSALGIVRMSGEGVWQIAARAVNLGEGLLSLNPRQATLVRVIGDDGDLLDEGVALLWKAPNSSTGEDLVEYIGHGSPVGLALVLERFLALGARPAEAGEFTRRAFINGKLSLDQAEGVASFIDAKTGKAARAAARTLSGGLRSEIHDLQDLLRDQLGLLELELDFGEEEIPVLDREQFTSSLRELVDWLEDLLRQADASRYLLEGIQVVIAGAANSGKSTLFNHYAGSDRAIVSATPGTTRDYLDVTLDWSGVPIRLIDTAGLRETFETIEAEGMRRTRELVEQADILLYLVSPPEFAIPPHDRMDDPRLILVRSKSDISEPTPESLVKAVRAEISAETGKGLVELRDTVLDHVMKGVSLDDNLGIQQRHRRHLEDALAAIKRAEGLIAAGETEELLASELRQADSALRDITGEGAAENLLNRIFERFCIGK